MSSRKIARIVAVLITIPLTVAVSGADGASEPANWLDGVSHEIRSSEYRFGRTSDGALSAPNRAHGLRSSFDEEGLRVTPRLTPATGEDWQLRFRLSGFGREGRIETVGAAPPDGEGNRIEFVRPGLVEWYVNDEKGLEQGFDIAVPPPGEGDLVLEISVGGLKAYPSADAASVLFRDGSGGAVLRYAGLEVFETSGRKLPAWFQFVAGRLRIVIDDDGAAYPLIVDPLMTSPAITLDGNAVGAQFGRSVATAGDIDGDGYSDILVGAPDYDTAAAAGAGRVDLFLGGPSGPSTTPDWTSHGDDVFAALFGWSVASAGDVNGDGYHDVIIGARLQPAPTAGEGKIFVFFGSANGLSATADWTAESNQSDAQLGASVSTAGDVNGDGYDDVIAGAFLYNDGEFNEGAAFVWLGGPAGLGANGTPLNAAWRAQADQASAEFGGAVATAGDVNGDGYGDVIIGAALYDVLHVDEGIAFVWYGSASGLGADGLPWNANASFRADQAQRGMGTSVAGVGDVDGDGFAEILVGAPHHDGVGGAFLWHGSSSGLPGTGTPASADWRASSNQPLSWFGMTLGTAGDINGDGYADVIVGGSRPTGSNGKAYAWFGGPSGMGSDGTAANADWSAQEIPASDTGLGWEFARSVATAGDIDGDGYSDVIVGAPFHDAPSIDEGQAFIYLGSSSGLSSASKWSAQSDQDDAHLGVSVATAGDIDADGYSDVIVGAPDYDGGQVDEGAIFVYHGSADGLAASSDWHAEGDQAGARLGRSAASAGDVNGDGFSDVVAGAQLYDGGQTDGGAVFVWFGGKSGLGRSGTPSNADWRVDGDLADGWFGHSVGGAGDVNGDGIGDLIVGAPRVDDPFVDNGRVTVYHGSTSGPSGSADWSRSGAFTGSQLGYSVATAGDVNGDGKSDVIVGGLEDQNGHTDEGRAYVYLGHALGLNLLPFWTGEANQIGAHFGASVGSAGDVNGDGYSDIIVGAPAYDDGEPDEGGVFVWLGGPTGMSGGGFGTPVNAHWSAQIDQLAAELGSAVAGAGDVNGDGYGDVIVGGKLANFFTLDDGGAWLWLGSESGLGSAGSWANAEWSTGANQVSAHFGVSVAAAGDVNGDGFGDVIVGAENHDFGQSDEGHAWVYLGNNGGGLDLRPLQHRVGSNDPVHLLGKSDDDYSFRIGALGRTPAGRGRVRLEWEAKPNTLAFNGNGQRQGSYVDSGVPDPAFGSAIALLETAISLRSGTVYHWRARIDTDSPYFPHSPWFSLPYDTLRETAIRTGGFPDLDNDGVQNNVDCNDGDNQVWSLPGQVGTLLALGDKQTFDWSAPVNPGGVTVLYDTFVSSRAVDFSASSASCLETDDGSDTEAVDLAVPASGRISFYVVRPENACGPGSVGPASSGAPRAVRDCP